METSLVSIILPTHNGSDFIFRAIEGVQSQSYQNWELVILNDGSTDNTKNIIQEYAKKDSRIVLVENEKKIGIQKTLNRGIQISKGEYIARLDDDDYWILTSKISDQVAFLESHPEYVLVGTDAAVVNTEGKVLSLNTMPKSDRDIRNRILSKNCFLHATIVMKKTAFEKSGGYKEDVHTLHVEDYDLWLRTGLHGKIANLSLVSSKLTAHPNSLSSQNRVLQAKNALSLISRYKKNYPNFFSGYLIGCIRYIGFSFIQIIPIPKSLLYRLQRFYRSL